MRNFNFVALFVITALRNVLTPHINKTYLPIVLLNVREAELNWPLKRPVKERGRPPCVGGGSPTPRKALRFIKQSSLSS